MAELKKRIGVAADLAGCPNRCRHCYLGVGPNKNLPTGVLREAAEAFWGWKRPAEDTAYFEQVDVFSWYREPDFRDDYKELYEIQSELSRREPRRYELLSIWRVARDPEYAPWAKEVGPQICQITFFGLEKVNAYFHRRRGAFRDALKATERLLEVGMIARWQIFLTKPGMADLDGLMRLVDKMRLRERVAELGAEFPLFCHPPGPDGEAMNIEDQRIEESDLPHIPAELMDATKKHFGGKVNWATEAALVERALAGETFADYVPEELWFFINAVLDVFPNYGEVGPGWRLGNFGQDSLDTMFDKFEQDAVPGLWASFHVPDAELAQRFGRPDSQRIYEGDIKGRWIYLYCEAEAPAQT